MTSATCWNASTSGMADPDRRRQDHHLGWRDALGSWLAVEAGPLEAPFIDRTRLERMLDELYEHFGAASFTVQWQYDRHGLLEAATRLLDDLRLIRRLPGGVLILPAPPATATSPPRCRQGPAATARACSTSPG